MLPEGQELAISLTDQTDFASPVLLWLTTGISPSATSVESGFLADGAVETFNDYGNHGYGTPCIEELGEGERTLQFRLHVLSSQSMITEKAPGNESMRSVQAMTIDSAAVVMKVKSSNPPASS